MKEIAVGLERVDLLLRRAELVVRTRPRDGEVGAHVEQLVLHAFEHRADRVVELTGERDAESEFSSSTAP